MPAVLEKMVTQGSREQKATDEETFMEKLKQLGDVRHPSINSERLDFEVFFRNTKNKKQEKNARKKYKKEKRIYKF